MFKDLDFKDLGERCIATFVETFIAMITAEALTGSDGDLLRSAFVGGLASVLSLLKNSYEKLQCQKVAIQTSLKRSYCKWSWRK